MSFVIYRPKYGLMLLVMKSDRIYYVRNGSHGFEREFDLESLMRCMPVVRLSVLVDTHTTAHVTHLYDILSTSNRNAHQILVDKRVNKIQCSMYSDSRNNTFSKTTNMCSQLELFRA